MVRFKAALSASQVSLYAEREAREKSNVLSKEQETTHSLSSCAATLSNVVRDLMGAEDVIDEAGKVRLRYDQMELENIRLEKQVENDDVEKFRLKDELRLSEERYANFYAESNEKMAQRDHELNELRSLLYGNGVGLT